MKSLVVYYSRTGHTKKVANSIAKLLKSDVEEIIDLRNRSGFFGYILAGFHALKKRQTKIKPTKKDVSKYGIVIIGTPIWAGDMAPAVRTYLNQNNGTIKKAAFFCTKGGGESKKAFDDFQKLCGKPAAVLDLKEKGVIAGKCDSQIKDFVKKIK